MKRKRFTEEQIIAVPQDHDATAKAAEHYEMSPRDRGEVQSPTESRRATTF